MHFESCVRREILCEVVGVQFSVGLYCVQDFIVKHLVVHVTV